MVARGEATTRTGRSETPGPTAKGEPSPGGATETSRTASAAPPGLVSLVGSLTRGCASPSARFTPGYHPPPLRGSELHHSAHTTSPLTTHFPSAALHSARNTRASSFAW